ncbi:MAG: hypothetical protein F9K22_12820 [Bacteroidetes bacterium]|nr:MAG: hypothetical protein F9K22_12820 [Bacteroidota bacterium]
MKRTIILLLLLMLAGAALAQQASGPAFYRASVHNGNRVKTVFGNWGVIGQPSDTRPRGAWIYSSNGYVGDVSLFVGAEAVGRRWNGSGYTDVKFHSVVTTPMSRPATSQDEAPTGEKWTFMPVSGYFNPNKQSIAMSDDPTSYPASWPDRMSDATDPGWKGLWNGYFGKDVKSADQESYFVMDDNNDRRFSDSTTNNVGGVPGVSFKPDANNLAKNGLALEVKVRGLQWAQFLAQDNIFWLYEITNTGTSNYDKAVFGMLVGTYVGVTGNNASGSEYDDDWSYYDARENITYTGDYDRNCSRNPFWTGPVGMVGYAFLESPGNPFDGVDNDDDAKNLGANPATPPFADADFDTTRTINAGSTIILIKDDFSRTVFSVPASPVNVKTRGADSVLIVPGVTKAADEGALITVSTTQGPAQIINPNAYDGVDNDFDGLIDENYYIHHTNYKKVGSQVIINQPRNVRYTRFDIGGGANPLSMVDERRDDGTDNDGDWDIRYDDVGRDGVADVSNPDAGEGDGLPTSGYLMNGTDTGLPGEPHVDKTDVNESDQIGLTSFQYFTPSNDVPLADDEVLWTRLRPGFFDAPQSITNGRPDFGQDGDFIYGSGYFPLLAKKTERFSLALVYGGGNGGSREDDITDLLKHKKTVQEIYDLNYQFAVPPPMPTLSAAAGDQKVKLYWDRKSESAFDPVLRTKDFQGYKIFKATDYEFNDAFDVTNALGVKKGYRAAFQVDVKDSVQGYFRAPADIFQSAEGFTYYLGSNTGLVHDTTDYDVQNGRTYYYVIVAYDNGSATAGLFPSQNSWKIDIDQAGRIRGTSPNVAIVVPKKNVLGYTAPPNGRFLTPDPSVIGTGRLGYNVVDETKLTGSTYEVTFLDTRDSGRFSPVTTFYSVRDTVTRVASVVPSRVDTLPVLLPHQNIEPGSVRVVRADGTLIDTSKYTVSTDRGAIRARTLGSLQDTTVNPWKFSVNYRYYPVYRSVNIRETPYAAETRDADIFDGMQVVFDNRWTVQPVDSLSGFTNPAKANGFQFTTDNIDYDGDAVIDTATRFAADYDMIFSDSFIDSVMYQDPNVIVTKVPVKWLVRNRTTGKKVDVYWVENDPTGQGVVSYPDQFFFRDPDDKDSLRYTWVLILTRPSWLATGKDTVFNYGDGDTLKLRTSKPFRKGDRFHITVPKPTVQVAKAQENLNSIRVVPNPYVVQTNFEAPVTPGTVGRGQRKIEFQNVPMGASISIYTARGEHIRTLTHDNSIFNGTVQWDLKTKENLDIAYGVYFYVVESSAGTKSGKIAVIK